MACGKTAVSDHLVARGHPVIDTDVIARALLDRGKTARARILKAFGTLDRRVLREAIFAAAEKRTLLESILHPLIWKEVDRRVRALKKKRPPLIFVVVPLLFETGSENRYDAVVSVLAPKAAQIRRLVRRDGIPRRLAAAMVGAQWPAARKARLSDHVIHNRGTLAELRKKTDRLIAHLSH